MTWLLRAHFEAFNSGDMERWVGYWRDDVELVVSPSFPEPGRHLGRDAAASWFGNYFRSFEPEYTVRFEKAFEVAGYVAGIARHQGIGRRDPERMKEGEG